VLLDFTGDGATDSAFDASDKARAHPFEWMVRTDLFGECEDVIPHGFLIDEHNDCGALFEKVAKGAEPLGDRVAGSGRSQGLLVEVAFIFQADHQLGHGERWDAGGLPVVVFSHQERDVLCLSHK
jgi:hypothetical protein